MIKNVCLVIIIFIAQPASAQPVKKNYLVHIGAENQWTTHNTNFSGATISFGSMLSGRFALGGGVEYAHCRQHADNGWNLTGLNMVPVFALQDIFLLKSKTVTPYAQLRQGISFINYHKESQKTPGKMYNVHERGFYGYAGLGGNITLAESFGLTVQTGFKAYHLSGDVLEVNPHGFTGSIGLLYYFHQAH